MKRREQTIDELEKMVRTRGKKFVSLQEGALLYSLGLHTFNNIAKEAGAIYKIKRRVLVNTELVDEYLETFREFDY